MIRRTFVLAWMLLSAVPVWAQTTADVRAALEAGDPAQARMLFGQLPEAELADAATWRGFASQLYRAGALDDALLVLQDASGRFPADARFPYLAGFVLQESGRCADAIPLFQQSLALAPNNEDAVGGLAACGGEAAPAAPVAVEPLPEPAAPAAAAEAGIFVDTPSATAPAAEPDPVEPALPAPAAPALATASAGRPTGQWATAEEAMAAGLEAASGRDWTAAAAAFRDAALLNTSDAAAWYRLGVAEALLGHTFAAHEAFVRARDLAPQIPGVSERVAQAQARLDFEAQTALDPAGYFEDTAIREQAGVDAAAAGLWLAASRAQFGAQAVPGELQAAKARLEGDATSALEASLLVFAEDPSDSAALLAAADAARLSGDLELADWLLELYPQLGGPADAADALREEVDRRRHATSPMTETPYGS